MGSIFPIRLLLRLWLVDLRHSNSSYNMKNGDQNNTWVETNVHYLDFDNESCFSECELCTYNLVDLRRVSVREKFLTSCQDTEDSSVTADFVAQQTVHS
jgi:hypothetical protein